MSIITGNKPRQILTIDDLMERWGVERDTVTGISTTTASSSSRWARSLTASGRFTDSG